MFHFGEHEDEFGGVALGYDEDGTWEMGALPLLIPLSKLAKVAASRVSTAKRNRRIIMEEARRSGIPFKVLRKEVRRQRRAARVAKNRSTVLSLIGPSHARPAPPRTTSTPFMPGLISSLISGVTMPRGRRLQRRIRRLTSRAGRRGVSTFPSRGGSMRLPGGCVIVSGDDGGLMAVDEFGNAAEIVGMEDDGGFDEFGADGGEFYGAEHYDDDDGDDGGDEEAMGAVDDAADEAEYAAETADDQQFGASVQRLERKLDRRGKTVSWEQIDVGQHESEVDCVRPR